jgi:hypothetical protein
VGPKQDEDEVAWQIHVYFLLSVQATVGFFMNVASCLVLWLAINTWGDHLFDLFNVPEIFLRNVTTTKETS